MNSLLQDLRYGLRTLVRQPTFTLVAALTLALGIGANTAVFSVVHAVLMRPLPFPEPENLVAVGDWDLRHPETRYLPVVSGISYPNFADWRAGNSVFSHLAAYSSEDFTLTDEHETAVHVEGATVTADLLPTLGVNPALGRPFRPEEDRPGSRVVIISHGLWQQRFGGDPRVLGRSINVDNSRHEIIGVMPPGFQFPVQNQPVELWTTIARRSERGADNDEPETEQRGNHFLRAVARLKSGVSVDQAQANLDTIAAALARQYPDADAHTGIHVLPLQETLVGEVRPALLILLGAAGCVLLIACVNVANLLLARATARSREIAIRAALGAGRGRIIAQLLTESVLLALLGGAGGGLLALWGTAGLVSLLPAGFPRLGEIGVDARVLAFTAVVSILTGLVCGLAPAWRLSRPGAADALRADSAGSRGATEGARGRRLREVLVVAEVALALALLSGAGLLIQSFVRLGRVPPGFDPRGVWTADVSVPQALDPQQPARNARFYEDLLARAAALPGVKSASMVVPLPMSGRNWRTGFDTAGRPVAAADRPLTDVRSVAPGYFRTVNIPLRRGRDFDARDNADAPGVAIVNETFARRYFPGEDPLGKRITPQISAEPRDPREREIVGVVGDVKARSLSRDNQPECYLPHGQFQVGSLTLVVRAADAEHPLALTGAMRNLLGEIDKDVPLYNVRAFDRYLAASVAQPRLNTLLLSVFAGVATLLTAVGLYGVMAYAVAQRTREIGIRLALGAGKGHVLRLIVGHGLRLTLIGLGVGLLAAFGGSRLLTSLLFNVSPGDPLTLAAISVLLAATAFLACWLPARRASRLDPMVALRQE